MSFLNRFLTTKREVRGAFRGTKEKLESPTSICVVGGGLAGITAALILVERGAKVTLIEQTTQLGGVASSWKEQTPLGTWHWMEAGAWHIYNHHYNLKQLLDTIGCELTDSIKDRWVINPSGMHLFQPQLLPHTPPLHLLSWFRSTGLFSLQDLRNIHNSLTREFLTFDLSKTFQEEDHMPASEYLEQLGFPDAAKHALYNVLADSALDLPEGLSAAVLKSRLHNHFIHNPEGMHLHLLTEPAAISFFAPAERLLLNKGVLILKGNEVKTIRREKDVWHLTCQRYQTKDTAEIQADAVVLASSMRSIQTLVQRSHDLQQDASWAHSIASLQLSKPVLCGRIHLKAHVPTTWPTHMDVNGGPIAFITTLERAHGAYKRYCLEHGGTFLDVIASAHATSKEDVLEALRTILKSHKGSLEITHESFVSRFQPAYAPGSFKTRPKAHTPYGSLVLAGEFTRLPFPASQLERAASSAILAANHLLDRWDVKGQPLYSVAPKGVLAFDSRS